MTFQDYVAGAQRAVSVLSDPRQSAIAASGLSGVLSNQINSLRKNALVNIETFGTKLGPSYQNTLSSILSPFKQILGGDGSIAENPSGTILGLTYLQAMGIGFVAFLGVIFLIGRGTR